MATTEQKCECCVLPPECLRLCCVVLCVGGRGAECDKIASQQPIQPLAQWQICDARSANGANTQSLPGQFVLSLASQRASQIESAPARKVGSVSLCMHTQHTSFIVIVNGLRACDIDALGWSLSHDVCLCAPLVRFLSSLSFQLTLPVVCGSAFVFQLCCSLRRMITHIRRYDHDQAR